MTSPKQPSSPPFKWGLEVGGRIVSEGPTSHAPSTGLSVCDAVHEAVNASGHW